MTLALAPWTKLRCPRGHVVAEVRALVGEVRKVCDRCPRESRVWRFNLVTGEVTLERPGAA